VKIIIADPNDLFRSLLKFWLNSENRMKLVGETNDGANVVELVARLNANILIIDPILPNLSGTAIAREIHEKMPEVRLVAVYQSNKPYVVDRLQKAGFHGCVCKNSNTIVNLKTAMESVMEGNAYFCAETCRVQNLIYNNPASFSRLLSIREQEILGQIGYGKDNDEIGFALKLSPATVQTHRRNLFKKLGIHDTPALMRYAIDQGFCQIESGEPYPQTAI
jgi:DNA-binding NarL/FixJ family response regulator